MRLKSRGLGRKELVMDFREYTVTRAGKEVVIEGTIHEPVHWDFSIRMCEDDLPGIAKVAASKNMIGFLLKSLFTRNKDSHWSVSRKEHLEAIRTHAEEAKAAAAKKDAEAESKAESKAEAAAGGAADSKSQQDKASKSQQDKEARTAKRIPDSVRNRGGSSAREAAAKKDKPSVQKDLDKPTKSVTFGKAPKTPGEAAPDKASSPPQGDVTGPGDGSPSGNGSGQGNGSSSPAASKTSKTTDAPSITTGTNETTTKVKEGNGS